MRLASALLLYVFAASAALTQTADSLPDRGGALVAASHTFAFYSDAVTNLHDFLLWNAQSNGPVEPAPNCLAALPLEQRAAFEHALAHYKAFATPAGNRLLIALRYRLAGFGDFGIAEPAAIDASLAQLSLATPAYQRCWWPAHDARNRRWIEALKPLLAAHEDALSDRLSELYGETLNRPFPVDVVSYGSISGADSVVDPDHLLVSSIAPANSGYAALEIAFHEASHTVFGPRLNGRLWTELEAAAQSKGAPLGRNFWHALLFYTTGGAVRARLAEQGVDYEQYVYAQGLFERTWPRYREPLERLWQPYVDGRMPMPEAVRQLVEALPPEPR